MKTDKRKRVDTPPYDKGNCEICEEHWGSHLGWYCPPLVLGEKTSEERMWTPRSLRTIVQKIRGEL